MIRFLADADLNHAIVTGCLRREPAMDFLSANEANSKNAVQKAGGSSKGRPHGVVF
jgi:hypothetical protein